MSQEFLRSDLKKARRKLGREHRRASAFAVRRHLANTLRFQRSQRVAFYMAAGGELDPRPLMLYAAERGKTCYLPVMTDRLLRCVTSPLAFQRHAPLLEPLVKNRYGILEPPLDPREFVRLEQLDIVFVPLVGFDRQGNRVGMGQGFYDRTLASLVGRYRRPWLVGLAFSVQEAAAIPANAWDIPLDAIVTEKGLLMADRF